MRVSGMVLCIIFLGLLLGGCGKRLVPEAPEVLTAQEYNDVLLPEEMDPGDAGPHGEREDDALAGDDGSHVVYIVLPTAEGNDAKSLAVLKERLESAGFSTTLRCHKNMANLQFDAFEEAVKADAMAIVCDDLGGDETVRAVSVAEQAGVPVFLMNRSISRMGLAQCQVVVNYEAMLDELAELVAETEEPSNCLIYEGIETDDQTDELMSLLKNELKKYVQLNVMDAPDDLTGDDCSRLGSILDNYPEMDTLICTSAEETAIAAAFLNARSRNDQVRIFCLYGDAATCDMIDADMVEAALRKPAEEMASMTADSLIRFFGKTRADWVERQYVTAELYGS